MVVESCLLHRSSESLQFKSSSTLVLHTCKAWSIKLCSSAAFLILGPQDLQTRSERFSSLVSGKTQSSRNTKISPTLSSLLDDENFSNGTLPHPEVTFTPQNLQLLFFWMSIFGFLGSCWHDTACRFSHNGCCAMNIFSPDFLRRVGHAENRAPYSDWSLNWQLC